jgi:hypothetical protein
MLGSAVLAAICGEWFNEDAAKSEFVALSL